MIHIWMLAFDHVHIRAWVPLRSRCYSTDNTPRIFRRKRSNVDRHGTKLGPLVAYGSHTSLYTFIRPACQQVAVTRLRDPAVPVSQHHTVIGSDKDYMESTVQI